MERNERRPFHGHSGHDHGHHGHHGGSGRWDGDRSRSEGRGRGRGGRGRGDSYSSLCQEKGIHLLMIGSYSCTRHKGVERLALQQEGKLSFLCLQEIDWITGDYLPQIEEAAAEVAGQFAVKRLILFGGCQVELQSLDTRMLTEELSARLGIPVEFHRGCHLVGYGDALTNREGGSV